MLTNWVNLVKSPGDEAGIGSGSRGALDCAHSCGAGNILTIAGKTKFSEKTTSLLFWAMNDCAYFYTESS